MRTHNFILIAGFLSLFVMSVQTESCNRTGYAMDRCLKTDPITGHYTHGQQCVANSQGNSLCTPGDCE